MRCPSCEAENHATAVTCAECATPLSQPTAARAAASGSPPHLITLDLRPGAVFHSRYEVIAPLGRGGMGMVFRAHDRVLDETVAIKVLRPDVAQDPRMAERFRGEIKLARKVRHRNVCAIHDYGEDQGLLYISMEMVEGVDLKRTLRESGPLPPARAFDVAMQIAEALQAVHDAGIVHRDLKTPNIMIDAAGCARLMDFGVAKRLGEGTFTTTGHVVGTPEYMSPEQAQGHAVDGRSDIYALGVVVYEIFTGEVPFRGETPISTILKHINDPPPLDKAALPIAMRSLLRRALAKDPAARYSTAREMGEALREARSQPDAPTAVTVDSSSATLARVPRTAAPRPAVKGSRRGAALQPWLLVVPAVAVGGGMLALYTLRRPTAAPMAAPSTTVAAAVATPPPAPAPTLAAALAARPSPAATPRVRPTPSAAATPSPRAPAPTPAPVAATVAPPSPAPSVAAAQPAAPGLLQVVVRPWGEVTVDGRVVGQTPLDRMPLSAGVHRVRIRHPSYEVWERDVTVRSGQLERVVVDFPASGLKKP
jgi:serine/threonine-protein kinase